MEQDLFLQHFANSLKSGHIQLEVRERDLFRHTSKLVITVYNKDKNKILTKKFITI